MQESKTDPTLLCINKQDFEKQIKAILTSMTMIEDVGSKWEELCEGLTESVR
jgi:hypothetical protein